MPESMIATMRSVVATGRRMKMRDGLIDGPLARCDGSGSLFGARLRTAAARLAGAGDAGRRRILRRPAQADLAVVAQLVGTVDHDAVAGRQARLDGDTVRRAGAELDRPH